MHVGQAGCSDDFSHSASNSLCVPHAVKHLLHPMPTRLMPATLVVGGVRNVYDWLMAMKRRCYCCDDFEKMELPAFLRTPFSNTKFDDGTCSWAADVVFQDRNRLFHNIIEARRLKMQNLIDLRACRKVRLGFRAGGVRVQGLYQTTAVATAGREARPLPAQPGMSARLSTLSSAVYELQPPPTPEQHSMVVAVVVVRISHPFPLPLPHLLATQRGVASCLSPDSMYKFLTPPPAPPALLNP